MSGADVRDIIARESSCRERYEDPIVTRHRAEQRALALSSDTSKANDLGDKVRRRLANTPDLIFEARLASQPVARRLGAIPLADDPSLLPTQPEMVTGPTTDSLPVVGMVSSALCLAGCLVKRFYGQLKARVRRDSLGFLPDFGDLRLLRLT